MADGRILFIGLSQQSTGELRFFTSLVKQASCERDDVHLALASAYEPIFRDFPGTLLPVPWPRKLSPDDVLRFMKMRSSEFRRVVILDLTSAILEYTWSRGQTEAFLEALSLDKTTEYDLFDVMGVLERDPVRLGKRLGEVESDVDAFIAENFDVPGRISVKKAFYFSRYLKPRTLSQLLCVPDSIRILRAVPYTWPDAHARNGATFFRCSFESVARSETRKGMALVGFSKMVENLLPAETISEYFAWISTMLRDRMGIDDLVVIDPSRYLHGMAVPPGMRMNIYERMERHVFLDTLSEAEFTGFFIPTATVGVTAIQNGIPFASFHSSQETSRYIEHKRPANAIPRYTSLGIWEDFAFIRNLLQRDNAYFRCVRMLDTSNPDEFDSFRYDLEGGAIQSAIGEYHAASDRECLPSFKEVVLS